MDEKHAQTIPQFCDSNNISRAHFYNLRKIGKGPRIFYTGKKPLISKEASADWRREREAEATEVS